MLSSDDVESLIAVNWSKLAHWSGAECGSRHAVVQLVCLHCVSNCTFDECGFFHKVVAVGRDQADANYGDLITRPVGGKFIGNWRKENFHFISVQALTLVSETCRRAEIRFSETFRHEIFSSTWRERNARANFEKRFRMSFWLWLSMTSFSRISRQTSLQHDDRRISRDLSAHISFPFRCFKCERNFSWFVWRQRGLCLGLPWFRFKGYRPPQS